MQRPETLLVCTHNQGKVREITALLSDLPIRLKTASDIPDLPEPEEDGDSFLANARIKAEAARKHTGLAVLADDSGLVVPALGGAPGVHSAYYGGRADERSVRERANRERLKREIAALPNELREGYFVCVMVLLWEGGEAIFEGRCEGLLITEERGEDGFGYDPLFLWPATGQTLAEMPPEEKNRISHRALALQEAKKFLRSVIG